MATLERNEAGRGRFGRVGCGKQALAKNPTGKPSLTDFSYQSWDKEVDGHNGGSNVDITTCITVDITEW